MKKHFYHLVCLLFVVTTQAQTNLKTDVLVVGASASGIAAGLQSARMGVNTIIAEPTTWLGGMITAAGVCAFDGNHNLPSGLFGEFRNALYKVYGGPSKVATGWVSNTQFEPHVGDSIFKSMVLQTKGLSIKYQFQFLKVIKQNGVITGATFLHKPSKKIITIYAKQVIDATELGDVMASAGIPYSLGMEASAETGEDVHVSETNDIVQDITYVAILKDYGMGKDCTIAKPANYDPAEFDGACTDYYFNKTRPKPNVDAQKMLNYGKLPNQKYMINWPGNGNDIYLNVVELSEVEREKELIKAKEQTLRFIYFIQHQLGFKHLGLADDEYPTKDRLPLIPYHRESRRVKGLVRFDVRHIAKPFTAPTPLYRTGIAVGDYPIDHHHKKNPKAPQHLDFYPVPSFNLPLGSLIPQNTKGLIIAEKSISVSNVVNGTTRLQAIALLIGQAAGTLAAITVQQNLPAQKISVRKVQTALLDSRAYIMPYFDVPIDHPHFVAAQKIGATGILRGQGVPYNWANRTLFHPDSLVNRTELVNDIAEYCEIQKNQESNLYLPEAVDIILELAKKYKPNKKESTWNLSNKDVLTAQIKEKWEQWKFGNFKIDQPLTRIQFAQLLNVTIQPFDLIQVDHNGKFKSTY
ncbi:FAD-dependent oxidoreductase [Sediminibacterium sp.]|uniref:FAD-dependent oxidoreductase n=1 Tax=Sediminibacterium sp. TaxID=1917865 RepID=UPI003F710065